MIFEYLFGTFSLYRLVNLSLDIPLKMKTVASSEACIHLDFVTWET